MASITSAGVGSGLDVAGLVKQLMAVESQPLTKLDTKEATYQAKISALGTLKGAVSSIDSALSALTPTAVSSATTTASLSNNAAAIVTAGSTAKTGSYTLDISQLAAAHKIATVGQAQQLVSTVYENASSSIEQGTLNLSQGGGASQSITIDSSNATLNGLKNAINNANTGISADIVPTTGGVRLMLSSASVGAKSKMTLSGLTGFDFDSATGSGALSQSSADGGRAAQGYNNKTDKIATGVLSIAAGNGSPRTVTIDSSNNTLEGLTQAINNSSAAVTAAIESVGSDNYRLVLTARATGADSKITVSGLDGFDFNGSTGTGSLTQSSAQGGQVPQDAIIKVNGTEYTSSSNTVTTAIAGVSLRLAQTTTETATLKIAKDETQTLARQASNKFQTIKAALGDLTIGNVTASASAAVGSYSLEVSQLATTHRISTLASQAHQVSTLAPQAHQLKSGAFGASQDLTDGINDSSLNISVGATTRSIAVHVGTTLEGLKTAINAANAGVTANVVADGANFRLTLTSQTAGSSGQIATSGLSGFDYNASAASNSLSVSQAAIGYASSADKIAEGVLSLGVGNATPKTITIDSTNNTLAGLKDAINNANAGVTASIVTDGLGVRLSLKSNTAGINGKIAASGLTGFNFNATASDLSDATANGGQAARGFRSAAESIPTGTLKLTVGGVSRNIDIDSSNNNLSGLKDAINKANAGVTATLVTSSTSDVRLMLTSNTLGTTGKISMSGISGFNFDAESCTGDLSQAEADGGQAALGSIVKINGISVAGESNTLTDAIQGVTLSVSKLTTSATTITVSQDKTSTLSSALTNIVKAYNDFNKSAADLSSYNAATRQGGTLLGNSTLRQVSTALRNAFQSQPSGVTSTDIRRLSDIGLEIQRDGSVTFNANKLTSAANADFEAVALLAASFARTTKTVTTSLLESKGTLAGAIDGQNSSIKDIGKQRETLNLRLVQIEKRYRAQFGALDSSLSGMQRTASYLTQQLSALRSSTATS